MNTLFTAWGYEVTYLELASVVTSVVAVLLGALGRRVVWPWWFVSSLLYGVFFLYVDLFASAILQLVFMAAAIWGWRDWQPSGVSPRKMVFKERVIWTITLITAWLITAPLLATIGAAATYPDSFLLISSTIAQVLMVLQRNETWFLWLVIDAFGTLHYARQGYWFTSLLYFIFTLIAVFGWIRWLNIKR